MASDSRAAHDEPLLLALEVIRVLEALGARAWVGGSLASSIFGVPRATQDADIVLHKLVWFREGGHVSDRQWSDALGVVQVQDDRLDHGYLRRMADDLAVSNLLEELLEEADEG